MTCLKLVFHFDISYSNCNVLRSDKHPPDNQEVISEKKLQFNLHELFGTLFCGLFQNQIGFINLS